MEQAATVAADYGIPLTTPFLGAESGGTEAEGMEEYVYATARLPYMLIYGSYPHAQAHCTTDQWPL